MEECAAALTAIVVRNLEVLEENQHAERVRSRVLWIPNRSRFLVAKLFVGASSARHKSDRQWIRWEGFVYSAGLQGSMGANGSFQRFPDIVIH